MSYNYVPLTVQRDMLLRDFDFAVVRRTINALDWEWSTGFNGHAEVPSTERIKKCVIELVDEAIKRYDPTRNSHYSVASGGFEAGIDSRGYLFLKFVAAELCLGSRLYDHDKAPSPESMHGERPVYQDCEDAVI